MDSLRAPEIIAHFRVSTTLGAGGMGVVYRAEDLLLHRPVALKVLRPEHVADPRRRARFLREARAAAALVHPNVATIHEVGEAGGTAFIAMELVPGETLRAVLQRGRVEWPRALRWSKGIARALAHAHEAGLVHRDLKPDNVMVMPNDEVKLVDFGIAKWLEEELEERSAPLAEPTTLEGTVIGTPAYVSPEQARGERTDVRSDVFSFGTMLYEMLGGVSPFQRATVLDTLSAVVHVVPPPLGDLGISVPPDVETLLGRCLAKGVAERFADGRELLSALQAIPVTETASDTPSVARRPSVAPLPPAVETESTFAPPGSRTSAPRTTRMTPWLVLVAIGVLAAGTWAVRSRPTDPVPVASIAPPADGCTSNAACVDEHTGEAWRCNTARKACVPLASPGCSVLASDADLRADDTIWFGALLPTTGPSADDIGPEWRAIDLARRDFSETLAGSFARTGDLHARRIGVVLCDEAHDPETASRHLVQDVGVPAVIGFRWADTALATIPSLFLPAHVLSFVSVSQAPSVTRIPQADGEARLVWRSTLNMADAFRPLSALVSDVLEPRVRAAGLGERPMRVAFVRTTRPVRGPTRDFGDELLRDLRFNGRSAVENRDDFRQFLFDEGGDAGGVVGALEDFAPHVILFQGATFARDILAPLERGWTTAERPIYAAPSGFSEDIASFIGRDPRRRGRFFGLANVTTTVTNANLVMHYNFTFPDGPVARTEAPQPSYDAFYTLAYAAEALGDGPITGDALSGAIDRLLPPGPKIEVGPSGILDGFKVLRSGGRIDLVGAIGPLDFDRATGEAPIDYAILCPGLDDRGNARGSVESGLELVGRENRLVGTLHCP